MKYIKKRYKAGVIYLGVSQVEYNVNDEVEVETSFGEIHKRVICKKFPQKDGGYGYSFVPNGRSREKKENKIDKLNLWAGNSTNSSNDFLKKAMSNLDGHTGEPIKIGHHSEKRHRRDLENHNMNIKKSIEMQEKAEAQIDKAENIEDALNRTIYLDDIDAFEKVKSRIEKIKNIIEDLKKRKKEIPKEEFKNLPYMERSKYETTSLNAKKRDLEEKLKTLEFLYS